MAAVEITMLKPNNVVTPSSVAGGCKTLNLKSPNAAAYLKGALKPEDVILTKNGSVYVKRFKCRVCQYKAAWESEMIRHEARVHGLDQSKKKPLPRPIPNLIPIQNNSGGGGGGSNCKSRETTPTKNGALPSSVVGSDACVADLDRSLTEKDLNDLYAKSCASSSLKDFASLIGSDEAVAVAATGAAVTAAAATKAERSKGSDEAVDCACDGRRTEQIDASKAASPCSDAEAKRHSVVPDAFKKKNASFFDRLKEKLMVGAGENHNLVCWCGHKSKCLSESAMHQKTHSESEKNDKSVSNGPLISGAELSSTRCQHCRHRCKTSSDLFVHLQSCPEMIKKENDSVNGSIHGKDLPRMNHIDEMHMEEDAEMEDESEDIDKFSDGVDSKPVKEEQRVFVWNDFAVDKVEESDDLADEDGRCRSPASESSLVGYEIAPGIGSVLPNNNEDLTAETFKPSGANVVDINGTEGVAKKVFKCPHCSFWASTASRFHVHIVSHMNVKPFGCSVCPYQSKWKWDVTKHIKLKKERDPTHESAEIQTIDMETGRRNYTKYNRYLTIMRVHEPQLDVSTKPLSSSSSSSPPLPATTIATVGSNPLPPTPPTSSSSPSSSSSVPVLPRLTPAPSIVNGDVEKGAALPSSTDVSMRPLPQLHPANPTVGMKRPLDARDDSEIPKKKVPSEKKMWKCKKCKFRNTDRNTVLAHVKEHYVNGSSQNRIDAARTANDAGDSLQLSQESVNRTDAEDATNSGFSSNKNINALEKTSADGNFKCEHCNFETSCSSLFRFHESHHVENPSAQYRCCFCPFYAHEKQFMSEHIASHGVENVEETLALTDTSRLNANGEEPSDICDESGTNVTDDGLNKLDFSAGDEMEIYKRFKCGSCPYVTNNKSQYLYHKQFHRLRNAPFKCNICSYNVTKRHLLHQHLKIHGVKRAQFKNCIKDAVEREEPDESFTLNTDVETSHLPDIPLVWVHKGGALTKMFKCRHCPHVNLRKSNIHEHEKMHFDRVQRSPNGSIASNQMSTHHCTECNYVCNNAGALASHFKVHQGAFGQICALADSRRSDESQIREITRLLREDERFKKDNSSTLAPPPPQLQPSPRLAEESGGDEASRKDSSCADVKSDLGSDNLSSSLMMDVSSATSGSCSQPATPTSSHGGATPVSAGGSGSEKRIMNFCNTCPARFISPKDLESHSRFHSAHHTFKCNSCTYSAPQQAQLLAHKRVHTNEYQEKTQQMCAIYECSKDNPRPRTAFIPDKPGFASLGWVVVHTGQKKGDDPSTPSAQPKAKVVTKQFSCHKCPAQFFKSVALQHHLTLHGGKDQYECRSCDYRVKTYGNLIKHESVHGLEPRQKAKTSKAKKPSAGANIGSTIPSSGTELFQRRTEQLNKELSAGPTLPPVIIPAPLTIDPEFGNLIHGSPDFMYQPTLKNGKMKEKRYKCHKCPSAFEKREQYKKHASLHGAESKFKCQKCDYSVSNYANYTQHMRKHDWNERSISERHASILSSSVASESPPSLLEQQLQTPLDTSVSSSSGVDDGKFRSGGTSGCGVAGSPAAGRNFAAAILSSTPPPPPEKSHSTSATVSPAKAAKTLHISVADQQAVVLMQQRLTDNGVNMADLLHRCFYCPYSHPRKDAVENHERCHLNPKGSFVCEFCNYTVPQQHFLREHQKLHFGFMKGIKPEAFMRCDRLEIWMETENGKVLIFKDNGSSARDEDRFQPKVEPSQDESAFKKMYVDVKTGEEYTPKKMEKPEVVVEPSAVSQTFGQSTKTQLQLPELSNGDVSASTSRSSSPCHVKEEAEEVAVTEEEEECCLEDVAEIKSECDVDQDDDQNDEGAGAVDMEMDVREEDDDLPYVNVGSVVASDLDEEGSEDEMDDCSMMNGDVLPSSARIASSLQSSSLAADRMFLDEDDDDGDGDVVMADEDAIDDIADGATVRGRDHRRLGVVANGGDGGDPGYSDDDDDDEEEDTKPLTNEEEAAAVRENGVTAGGGGGSSSSSSRHAAVAAGGVADGSDTNDSDSSSSSSSSSSSCSGSGSSCSSSDTSDVSDDEEAAEAVVVKEEANDEISEIKSEHTEEDEEDDVDDEDEDENGSSVANDERNMSSPSVVVNAPRES